MKRQASEICRGRRTAPFVIQHYSEAWRNTRRKGYSPNAAAGGTATLPEGPGDGRVAQRVGDEDADWHRDSEGLWSRRDERTERGSAAATERKHAREPCVFRIVRKDREKEHREQRCQSGSTRRDDADTHGLRVGVPKAKNVPFLALFEVWHPRARHFSRLQPRARCPKAGEKPSPHMTGRVTGWVTTNWMKSVRVEFVLCRVYSDLSV